MRCLKDEAAEVAVDGEDVLGVAVLGVAVLHAHTGGSIPADAARPGGWNAQSKQSRTWAWPSTARTCSVSPCWELRCCMRNRCCNLCAAKFPIMLRGHDTSLMRHEPTRAHVGESVVQLSVVGPSVVGPSVVGLSVVGLSVVGLIVGLVVGLIVVGLIVGLSVMGEATWST